MNKQLIGAMERWIDAKIAAAAGSPSVEADIFVDRAKVEVLSYCSTLNNGPAPTTKDAIEPELYLLQNVGAGFVGNSPLFWGASGGYTHWIDDAKRWTLGDAESQIRTTRGSHTWRIWSVDLIEAAAKRTVDIQDLLRPEASK